MTFRASPSRSPDRHVSVYLTIPSPQRQNLPTVAALFCQNPGILIRAGTAAYGTVTKSRRSGAWGKRGLLDFSIDYTTAVDGQRVPLRGNNGKGGRRGGKDAWATAMIVALVAGFFMKGGNATVEPGMPLLNEFARGREGRGSVPALS